MIDKIKAVVIDDSAFMRKSLSIILKSDPDIEVVGTARDGIEGVELVKKVKPDIVTLDIEMPRMNGLEALEIIMKEAPTSVIMVSSLTTEGADATIKALEIGAVDFIPKEMSFVSVNIINIKEDLIKKIKTIVRNKFIKSRLKRLKGNDSGLERERIPRFRTIKELPKFGYKAIALGISTGGPLSLQKLVPNLTGKMNIPFFIVQHMPPRFTKSLADRLNNMCPLEVKEAENREEVKNGVVYIAPGGFHMKTYKSNNGKIYLETTEMPSDTLHRPSVDVMLKSVLGIYGKHTMGIIMTGMGKDGLEGIRELKRLGGYCLAQDEDSCVVYGMPKAVVDAGFADVIAPLEKISEIINRAV